MGKRRRQLEGDFASVLALFYRDLLGSFEAFGIMGLFSVALGVGLRHLPAKGHIGAGHFLSA
jgi:hypothetical protein